MEYNKIPIIIISFNRLSNLKDLVEYFLKIGEENIIILDNNSTYPPLLEWLHEINKNNNVNVNFLDKNYGHTVYWNINFKNEIKDYEYFVYTDNDIIPYDFYESNWKEVWIEKLNKHKVRKVGAAISINDIPNSFELKNDVVKHESQFWEEEIKENTYLADIDTTIFLSKTNCNYEYGPALRLSNYLIKHQPWYVDYKNLSEEDEYYFNNLEKSSHWSRQIKNNE